jgi:hypothetical protein
MASCRMKPIWRPRIARQDRSDWRVRSTPARSIRSALTRAPGPVRPTSVRAVTLLPEPDSPTMARQRPVRVVNEMPLTTSVSPNDTRRFSTCNSGVPIAVLPVFPVLPAFSSVAAVGAVIARLLPDGAAAPGPGW